MREHLNKSVSEEGLLRELQSSKPASFLSYPSPECSCRTSDSAEILGSLYGNINECPNWMEKGLKVSLHGAVISSNESQEDDAELDKQMEPGDDNSTQTKPSLEQDEEMDPDD